MGIKEGNRMAGSKKKEEKVIIGKGKAGRPSTYNKSFHPILATAILEQGCTDEELAKKIGININTLYLWKREHKEFKDACEKAREIPNAKVIKSLFERATGYDYEEVEMRPYSKILRTKKDGTYNQTPKMVVTKIVKKKALPDIGAITLWLINKTEGEWKNRQSIEGNIKSEYEIIPADPNAVEGGKKK